MILRKIVRISAILSLLLFFCCQTAETKEQSIDVHDFYALNVAYENGIIEDFYSPPVAARMYAYPNIAAYECLAACSNKWSSLNSAISHLPSIDAPKETVNAELAAIAAFIAVGKRCIYTSQEIEDMGSEYFPDNSSPEVMASKKYGEYVGQIIFEWSGKDNYKQTRSGTKYSLEKSDSSWTPTPPDYKEGLEPNWPTIRPFYLEKADQFTPAPPTSFSLEIGSQFHNELLEVYQAVSDTTPERVEIAKFWDCNPLVSVHHGHLVYNEKKLTPGGHWMNIMRQATTVKKVSFVYAAYMHAVTASAMHDAFISCWTEKYRSVLIRPETLINLHIDPEWRPLLQTPNFPEHTSGHSVVSGAASTVLTHYLGDGVAYVDSSEARFGMPNRSFTSFNQAAEEAAISRMYGGIHYMPAIVEGQKQGKACGSYALERLKGMDLKNMPAAN